MSPPAPLETLAADGPIPLSDYMAAAARAYYRRPRVFGAAGDFVTAPDICQAFGELIGLWFALRWQAEGRPGRFVLAECGPGRGTLIADALRAAASVPGFAAAIDLHLVETSPTLRAAQAEALKSRPAAWHDDWRDLPAGVPIHLVANEFLDALPIRRFRFTGKTWREIWVERRGAGFAPCPGPAVEPPAGLLALTPRPPAEGDELEHGPEALAFAAEIARRIAGTGGAALIFDYGYERTGYGDTLQAVAHHRRADPFAAPGAADITAHVNFEILATAARAAGARIAGPAGQGDWLVRMGLAARIERLAARATPAQARELISGARRLAAPEAMGRLFKVLALLPPGNGPKIIEGFAS